MAGGPGRAGRRRLVLLLLARVCGGAGVLRRRWERAASVGHAAREPAAAQLVGVGRVLLHHRTAPVHAGRGADRAGPLGCARGRRHDVHAARAAGGRAGQGERTWRPGTRPRAAGRGPDAVPPAQRHLDRPALARPHRNRGAPAGDLAADRPVCAAMVRARAGRPGAHPGHGGRLDRAAYRYRAADARRFGARLRRADQARGTAGRPVVRTEPGRRGRGGRRGRLDTRRG